jgi:hypothetical protein
MKLTFEYKIILSLILITFFNMVITCWPTPEQDDTHPHQQRHLQAAHSQPVAPATIPVLVQIPASQPTAMLAVADLEPVRAANPTATLPQTVQP